MPKEKLPGNGNKQGQRQNGLMFSIHPSVEHSLRNGTKEKLTEMRPILWIELVAWILVGWAFSSWRTAVIGYIMTVPVLFALPVWGEYRRMKWERRDILLRRGVPDDQL